jgi:uncharacterized protein YehS (DUF1456 family)
MSVPELDDSLDGSDQDSTDEVDELSFSLDQEERGKENRAPAVKPKSRKTGQVVKQKQSRRSLLSSQPLSQVSTEDDLESSDDELSMM